MRSFALVLLCFAHHRMRHGYGPASAAGVPDVAPPPRGWRAARLRWPTACRWPGGIPFAAPRAQRASSLPPLQTRAGRCRCAHARRCRGLPSTISCRFRRSHPPETALDIFRRACNDEELRIERMPMKRHDDTQRSGRLTVTQPVRHIVPPYPRTPVPPGLFIHPVDR